MLRMSGSNYLTSLQHSFLQERKDNWCLSCSRLNMGRRGFRGVCHPCGWPVTQVSGAGQVIFRTSLPWKGSHFSLSLFTATPPHAVASCSMSEFERAIKTASSRSPSLAGSLESLYKLLCCLGVSSGKVSELPAGGLHKGKNHKEMKDITKSSTDWQILLQKNSAAVYSSVSV